MLMDRGFTKCHFIVRLILYIVILSFFITSCNDFLDKNPDNRANLDSPENIAALLISAYPQYSHVWFTEVMSDNCTDVGPGAAADDVTLRQMYNWERVDGEEQDSPDGYWYSCYEAIAAANHALKAISELEKSEFYTLTELNPLKGEALICRAYAHFMLVNLFAEHYDPQTASTTPGIPYVTEPEDRPLVDYQRLSVEDVYKAIVKDLLEGFSLIRDEVYEVPKWHFNRKAAATFMSRFYLYRGHTDDWDKVVNYANIALEDNPKAFLRDWLNTSGQSFDVFGANYSRSSVPANFLIISNVTTAARAWYYRYTMTLELLRTRVVYGDPHPTQSSITNRFIFINKAGGNTTYGCYGIFKYVEVFKREGINANYGLPYIMNTPLVAEEALFNLMEAEVLKENYNKVVDLLNIYYSTRVEGYIESMHRVTDATITAKYSGTAANRLSPEIRPHFTLNEKQKTYLKCIITVRASEFVTDGQRWFDIKRMRMPVTHAIFGGGSVELTSDDPRRVIPLPQDANRISSTGPAPAQPASGIEISPIKTVE